MAWHTPNIKGEKEEQLTLANMLSKILISYSEIGELSEAFTKELKRYISINWGVIARMEAGDALRLSPLTSKINLDNIKNVFLLTDTPLAQMVKEKRGLLESDLTKSSTFRDTEFTTYIKTLGIRTVVYMPLFSGEKVFGSLIVGSKKANAYKERELKLIKYAASQIAIPVRNSYLTEENQRREDAINWFRAMFHYTKTPLTPITSSSVLLTEEIQRQPNQPEAQLLPLALNIQEATQRLRRNLSFFEKIVQDELPKTQMNWETIQVEEMLISAASYARTIAINSNRSFKLTLPPKLPWVTMDSPKIEQVLYIMLDNAARRTPEGGKVQLQASVNKRKLVIEVLDSGPILSAEEKEEIIKPFDPSQADRLSFPELSLSMAICRHTIELHGGMLKLESSAEEGTNFSFSLATTSVS